MLGLVFACRLAVAWPCRLQWYKKQCMFQASGTGPNYKCNPITWVGRSHVRTCTRHCRNSMYAFIPNEASAKGCPGITLSETLPSGSLSLCRGLYSTTALTFSLYRTLGL